LTFCYRNWDGFVPNLSGSEGEQNFLRPADLNLLALIGDGFDSVGNELEAVRLRSALSEAMKLATAVNVYLDVNAPWSAIKKDRESAAKTIYTALKAIDSLKVLFAPFLPFTSERLHRFLGYEGSLFGEQYIEKVKDTLGEHTVLRYRVDPIDNRDVLWKPSELKPGRKLNEPGPLFKKLDESVVEEERARLGN
jgi:methionyl-tRNA synthetase